MSRDDIEVGVGVGALIEVPECFMGPVTTVAMFDPVALVDGHVYERATVEGLIQLATSKFESFIISPMTRQEISIASLASLKTSVFVRNAMYEWIDQSSEHRKAYALQASVPETPDAIAALAGERDQRLCLDAWVYRMHTGLVELPSGEEELQAWLGLVWRYDHVGALKLCLATCDVTTLALLANDDTPAPHRALRAGKCDLLLVMLQHDPTLLSKEDKAGYRLIQLAAKLGFSDRVRQLVALDPDQLKVARSNGDNLAHIAARFGRGKVLDVLQAMGAGLFQQKNKLGWYPAHIAVSKGRLKTTRRLVKYSPAVFTKPDKSGCTVLNLAKKKGKRELVTELGARSEWKRFFRRRPAKKRRVSGASKAAAAAPMHSQTRLSQ